MALNVRREMRESGNETEESSRGPSNDGLDLSLLMQAGPAALSFVYAPPASLDTSLHNAPTRFTGGEVILQ